MSEKRPGFGREHAREEVPAFFFSNVTSRSSSSIDIFDPGTDDVTARYSIVDVGSWESNGDKRSMPAVLSGGGEKKSVIFVQDSASRSEWIEDTEGNRLTKFDGDIQVNSYSTGELKEKPVRSPEVMQVLLDRRDFGKQTVPVMDESGKVVCDLDISSTGQVISVRAKPYVNVEGVAEKPNEQIYLTGDDGEISDARSTRGEARAAGDRYLVVSCLMFHDGELLLQKRSADKKIDPDKQSASAHGVATEVYREGKRINHVDEAAFINTALEINEELRHGEEVPFTVVYWPGTKDELFAYAASEKIDDSNTIYFVPEALYAADSYPLGSGDNKRTRSLATGMVFSKNKPHLSIDPAEVQGVEWQKASKLVGDNNATDDLQAAVDVMVIGYLEESRRASVSMAEKSLRESMGEKLR